MLTQVLDLTNEIQAALMVAGGVLVLLVLLVASFLSRPRVFCQYLNHMTGIRLRPKQVRRAFKKRKQSGVRDLLIDLLVRQDITDSSDEVSPDSEPDLSVFEDAR